MKTWLRDLRDDWSGFYSSPSPGSSRSGDTGCSELCDAGLSAGPCKPGQASSAHVDRVPLQGVKIMAAKTTKKPETKATKAEREARTERMVDDMHRDQRRALGLALANVMQRTERFLESDIPDDYPHSPNLREHLMAVRVLLRGFDAEVWWRGFDMFPGEEDGEIRNP